VTSPLRVVTNLLNLKESMNSNLKDFNKNLLKPKLMLKHFIKSKKLLRPHLLKRSKTIRIWLLSLNKLKPNLETPLLSRQKDKKCRLNNNSFKPNFNSPNRLNNRSPIPMVQAIRATKCINSCNLLLV
jgi:hypothetical protein